MKTEELLNPFKVLYNLLSGKRHGVYASVGDVCTKKLFSQGIRPKIVVVDGKTARNRAVELDIPKEYTQMPLVFGGYNERLLRDLEKISKTRKKYALVVLGEEDSLVWGILRYAPLNSKVVSGKESVVVTNQIKKNSKLTIGRSSRIKTILV